MKYNPDDRISAEEALHHNYFDSIRNRPLLTALYADEDEIYEDDFYFDDEEEEDEEEQVDDDF